MSMILGFQVYKKQFEKIKKNVEILKKQELDGKTYNKLKSLKSKLTEINTEYEIDNQIYDLDRMIIQYEFKPNFEGINEITFNNSKISEDVVEKIQKLYTKNINKIIREF